MILPGNVECLEVHDLCFSARGEMSGGLDYSVVCRVMDLMHIDDEDQLEMLRKIQAVEAKLKEENKQ